jgi:predicted NBD/HSP70 family sugar kinase
MVLDTFVGAGIVAENRLWEGVNGNTASLGSMLVTDTKGQTRFLHEVASMHALSLRLAAGGFGLDDVRAKKVPAGAAAILDTWIADATDAVAQTLINTTRVMEFEVCIIESELPPAITTRIVEATRARIAKFPTLGQIAPPPVIAGHLGHSGAAQGAALLHMHRRFFSRDFAHMDV